MKFASFEIDGSQSYGVVDGGGVIDLKKRMDGYAHGLIGILRKDGLAQAAKAADGADPDYGLDDVQLLSPIPNPEKIICIGVNYGDRNAEYQDGSDGPGYPSVFMRTRETLVGHGANLIRPPESEQLDYEGEIGVIIGKSGRRIAEADARDHIAGLTCINDCPDKHAALTGELARRGMALAQAAFVGNDVNDLACLKVVGLPIVVRDAHPDVLPFASYHTLRRGGEGAVREICDLFEAVHGAAGGAPRD